MSIAPVLEQPPAVARTIVTPPLLSANSTRALARTLTTHAIHVWTWAVPELAAASVEPRNFRLLSPDERARADGFHFAHHRAAYIENRGRLRRVLAYYLEIPPQEICFAYGAQGKPEVAVPAAGDITFNLSHAPGRGALAVGIGRQIGIDIERVRPMEDCLEIARQQFAPLEYATLRDLDAHERNSAFYACWTRKEAFLKGLGDGLQRSLADFTVSSLSHQAPALLDCRWNPAHCFSWQIQSLEPARGYTGALAYEGKLLPEDAVQTFTLLD